MPLIETVVTRKGKVLRRANFEDLQVALNFAYKTEDEDKGLFVSVNTQCAGCGHQVDANSADSGDDMSSGMVYHRACFFRDED